METLLIVDGHSIAFRAFYALPDSLRDREGRPVQAVYGFLSILFNQIQQLGADLVIVALDEGRPFREEIFADYKAGRQEIEPEVARQVLGLRRVLTALEIPQYALSGFEADDLIATLARQAVESGRYDTVVLSGDRDLFGIIGPRVRILYPTRSMAEAQQVDAAALYDRWAIEPGQVADFKALVGDPSDNIPGVRGIGEKGAAQLLQRFGTLDEILARVEEVTPTRARNALLRGQASALLSRRLARLVPDVPGVTLDPDAARLGYDRAQVESLFDEFGFNSLRDRLP